MKKIILSLTVIVCILLSSCDEKRYSFSPTWKGFQYYTKMDGVRTDNAKVYPSDSLYVIACQKEKGQYIEGTNYDWTFTCDTTDSEGNNRGTKTITYHVHTNYDGTSNADPIGHVKVPEGAVPNTFMVISFKADYHYYAQGSSIPEGNVTQGQTYYGTISSHSGEMFGGATGSVRLPISAR